KIRLSEAFFFKVRILVLFFLAKSPCSSCSIAFIGGYSDQGQFKKTELPMKANETRVLSKAVKLQNALLNDIKRQRRVVSPYRLTSTRQEGVQQSAITITRILNCRPTRRNSNCAKIMSTQGVKCWSHFG
ncbi:hypothetical protein MKX01_029129, partial [Papaver californicum]